MTCPPLDIRAFTSHHITSPSTSHNITSYHITSQITKFMGPTWGPPGSCRSQMGPMLAPRILLSGITSPSTSHHTKSHRITYRIPYSITSHCDRSVHILRAPQHNMFSGQTAASSRKKDNFCKSVKEQNNFSWRFPVYKC